jgi:hypothetical protein
MALGSNQLLEEIIKSKGKVHPRTDHKKPRGVVEV